MYYSPWMIQSFADRRTERFAQGERVPAFQGFVMQAQRRLRVLEAATSLQDLRALRSNRLELLRGDLSGLYSIRINRQWRLVFAWQDEGVGPESVQIMDYH